MPALPALPGVYAWELGDDVVYVGQTRSGLMTRLGPNGYSTISTYNTLARQPRRTNGGQQTNCRVNALANVVLAGGGRLVIWYRVTSGEDSRLEEARWMSEHGKPDWNRRVERANSLIP